MITMFTMTEKFGILILTARLYQDDAVVTNLALCQAHEWQHSLCTNLLKLAV